MSQGSGNSDALLCGRGFAHAMWPLVGVDLPHLLLDTLGETPVVEWDLQEGFLMLAGRSLRGDLAQRRRLQAVGSWILMLLGLTASSRLAQLLHASSDNGRVCR
jgi:hypothetical protein